MQALVLTLAIFRFYLLGLVQPMAYVNVLGQRNSLTTLISVFSFLLFGQIIDNQPQSKQKTIFCALELSLALWFLVLGSASFYDAAKGKGVVTNNLLPVSLFLSSGFQISTAL